jgi:hypothetical protein
MVNKKNRAKHAKPKKNMKKASKPLPARHKKEIERNLSKTVAKGPSTESAPLPPAQILASPVRDSRVFTIEIDSIKGETTIGDLIVAFPRTRDVLMKHGMSFDVEEAGYLYMTLNVFSAIHGLVLHGLIQELDIISKEPVLPPLAQPPRQTVSPPTA